MGQEAQNLLYTMARKTKNKIESYRTISLLKVYNKILPKLLCLQTTRMCPQTVINSAKRTGKPIHIVFLDARVAFDLTTTKPQQQ